MVYSLVENRICENDIRALAEALSKMPQLTILSFNYNNLDAACIQIIVNGLPKKSRLVSLNFGYNSFGTAGAKTLAEAFPSMPQLTYLNLCGISEHLNRHEAIGEAIAAGLPSLSQLTYLNLSSNNIGSGGAKAISEVLLRIPLLTSLYLDHNLISGPGVEALAVVFPQMLHLAILSLYDKAIINCEKSVAVLADALPKMLRLISLRLYDICISEDVAKALAATLPGAPNLANLLLTSNYINDASVQALAAALPNMPLLTDLNFGANHISDDGAQALARVLPSLPRLTFLGLTGNNFGEAGTNAIIEAIVAIRLQGRTIEVRGNSASNKITEEKIQTAMKKIIAERELKEKAAREAKEHKAKEEKEHQDREKQAAEQKDREAKEAERKEKSWFDDAKAAEKLHTDGNFKGAVAACTKLLSQKNNVINTDAIPVLITICQANLAIAAQSNNEMKSTEKARFFKTIISNLEQASNCAPANKVLKPLLAQAHQLQTAFFAHQPSSVTTQADTKEAKDTNKPALSTPSATGFFTPSQ